MKETIKTIAFVVVGLVLALSAWAVNFMSKPKAIDQFASVGEEFFPDFRSPEDAKYLEVAAYDKEASKAKKFSVEYKDRLWRIPSHYDYPAEAKDRLVETATSVIGIRREALAGRRESEHERFGVIDPLADDIKDTDAVGKRVSLRDADGAALADFIVGKQVPEDKLNDEQLREIRGQAARQPMYYVRRPDEVETFMATLNLDVSTKFSDWIEPDLLKLDANELRQLVIDKYTVEHREEEVRRGPLVMLASRPVKVEEELHKLSRDSDFGPWKLEGLNEESEEVDASKISTLTSSLDNLKILGVRPRFQIEGQPLLTADLQLRIPPSMRSDRNAIEQAIEEVQSDLASKGFAIDVDQSGDEPKARLLSDKGELTCASGEGVVYHLHFGNVFLGSDTEIEIGGNEEKTAVAEDGADKSDKADVKAAEGEEKKSAADDSADQPTDAKSSGDSSADAKSEGNDKQDKKDSSSEKKNRYLLVRVEYDPALVVDKPFKPIKPIEPKKPETTEESSPDQPDSPDQPEKKDQPDESKPDDDAAKKDADATEKKPAKDKSGDDADDSGKSSDEKADNAKSADERSSCVDLSQDAADKAQGKAEGESKDGDAGDEEKPAEPEKTASDDPAIDDDGKKPEDEKKPGDEPDSEKPETKPDPEADYQRAQVEYHLALQQYEEDEKKYEEDVKAYEAKLAQGKQKVEELNERFAAWYYVISAENLESLRLSRAELVKEKPKPEKPPTETEQPDTTEDPSKEGDAQPPKDSEKKDGDKSEDDQPSKQDADKQDADKGQGGDEKKTDDVPDGEPKDDTANPE